MPHTSETTWPVFSAEVSQLCRNALNTLNTVEAAYQDMLEAYQYAGSTDTLFAGLLFYGDPTVSPAPTADEIAKATDLKNAMTSLHQMYQGMNSTALASKDRTADLIRMS